ncbi:MAG TPA: tRNA-dihydrouridine synthase family protein [Candidatus Limnocylindria bacterium]|nr:tRNA-dihydrouridine synthase family protein [Candidatus Limnocylindria bacterium]
MTAVQQFEALLQRSEPLLALAPMQDVTDLPFWTVMSRYGGPDVYWTEYFRVHSTSTLEKYILKSLTHNPTGRPAIAQLIGNDIPALVKAAKELQQYPIVAVDLNLGCPAPIVYRKCAGGGLLREPKKVDAILGALRDAVGQNGIRFTVKTRIGFDDRRIFDDLLPIFARHSLDLLTVHGRTVLEMYRSEVHYDAIQQAVAAMPCPVLANGNVSSAESAAAVLDQTRAKGLMIGRGAIRNPWIFDQIRAHQRGESIRLPKGIEILDYVRLLYDSTTPPELQKERLQVEKMKKYMVFLGVGVDAEGQFLHHIRRATTRAEFFRICDTYLDHANPMPLTPFSAKSTLPRPEVFGECEETCS